MICTHWHKFENQLIVYEDNVVRLSFTSTMLINQCMCVGDIGLSVVCQWRWILFVVWRQFLKGEGTEPLTKNKHVLWFISKNTNTFFEKWYMHLIENCPRNSKMALKFEKAKPQFLNYWSKHYFECLIHNFKTAWPNKILML